MSADARHIGEARTAPSRSASIQPSVFCRQQLTDTRADGESTVVWGGSTGEAFAAGPADGGPAWPVGSFGNFFGGTVGGFVR